MKKIVWRVELLTLPKVVKRCNKCKSKREFVSSNLFRINANQKKLDVWLVYKCEDCKSSWKLDLFSRVRAESLPPELLDGLHRNQRELAIEYATDYEFLSKNSSEIVPPEYEIIGEEIELSSLDELEIRLVCPNPFPVKLSKLLRAKLGVSGKEFEKLVERRKIQTVPEQKLGKIKLQGELIIRVG